MNRAGRMASPAGEVGAAQWSCQGVDRLQEGASRRPVFSLVKHERSKRQ
jgi:hypothetical protein